MFSEVEQQSNLAIGSTQIVENLLFAVNVELLERFQLKDHGIFNDHIGAEIANAYAAEVNGDGDLPSYAQSSLK